MLCYEALAHDPGITSGSAFPSESVDSCAGVAPLYSFLNEFAASERSAAVTKDAIKCGIVPDRVRALSVQHITISTRYGLCIDDEPWA